MCSFLHQQQLFCLALDKELSQQGSRIYFGGVNIDYLVVLVQDNQLE